MAKRLWNAISYVCTDCFGKKHAYPATNSFEFFGKIGWCIYACQTACAHYPILSELSHSSISLNRGATQALECKVSRNISLEEDQKVLCSQTKRLKYKSQRV